MWKVFYDFKNADRIFPTQQSDVLKIIQAAPLDKIRRIIVFGSSVTSACNPWSDIDLFVDFGENESIHFKVADLEVPLDRWDNHTVDNRLLKEIEETGVVVYGE